MAERNETQMKFDEIVVPHIEYLYRVGYALTRNSTDAGDLVQDTLLRAYRAIDRFDGRYPKAWLSTIMRNAHINAGRKKRPELLFDPDATFERDSAKAAVDNATQIIVDPVFDEHVAAAFNNLSDDFKQVIELVDLGGLSYQEAADSIDVPVGTVMSRLHRARKRIRDHLTDSSWENPLAGASK